MAGTVLKRDVFSTIERGRFRTDSGEVEPCCAASTKCRGGAGRWRYELFRRERKALARAKPLGVAPPLLFAGRRVLVRGWIDGVPLHIAKPHGDAGYFRSAKAALRALHRAGIAHNDLAKEQNWLYAPRRGHGRAYPDRLPARRLLPPPQSSVPDRPLRGSAPSPQAQAPLRARRAHRRRAPRAGAQELDHARVDGDRKEGLLRDHARLEFHRPRGPRPALRPRGAGKSPRGCAPIPQVRDVAIVPFPDRRAGTGLYAFVEGTRGRRRAARIFSARRGRNICRSSTLCRATRKAKCAARSSNSWR